MSSGLEKLPRIEETMTNSEFVKACRRVIRSLHGKALRAKKKHESNLGNKNMSDDYLSKARDYYLFSKMVHFYTHHAAGDAMQNTIVIIPKTDPKDMN